MDQPKDPHFEIYKAKDDQFYFRLVGANGEKMVASEGYHSKSEARRAVARLCDLFRPIGKQSLDSHKIAEVQA